MNEADEMRRVAEERALDALIASFFQISSEDAVGDVDAHDVLDDDDRRAIEGLGDELVDRLVARRESGDADLPRDVLDELEQHRRDLLADEDMEFEG